MRDIQQKLDVPWVRGFHERVELGRTFAQAAHVIVISHRYSEIDGTFADLAEQSPELLEVFSDRLALFWARRVGHLQISTSSSTHEVRMLDLSGNLIGFDISCARSAPGKRDELQPTLAQQIDERFGSVAEVLKNGRT